MLRFAANFNNKAKLWVFGRKAIFIKLEAAFKKETQPIIWMHCASLGEFEQGRPLVEVFKKDYPQYKILLTFFSPSGFEIRKNYPLADYIFYLPIDNPTNANRFLDIVQPKLVFFVKYEFWYYYLKSLKERQIKYYLIAGVFRQNQFFFKWYGKWYLEVIKGFDHFFIQDKPSLALIKSKGIENGVVVGDPRIDRVVAIAQGSFEIPLIKTFKGDKKLFIIGSTHLKDEQVFFEFLHRIMDTKNFADWKFLIAPHEIKPSIISRIEELSPIPIARYTKGSNSLGEQKILILDTIGLLSNAYQYGTCAYIGGGFNKSIHNILEPAVYSLPIFFGPNYAMFPEAMELTNQGGAISINNSTELLTAFEQLNSPQAPLKIGTICSNYISKNQGATKSIINYFKTTLKK